jgi:hypothetical protein
MFATCHTEACGNAEHPIDVGDLTAYDANGDPDPTGTAYVVCGVCSQPITDVSEGVDE